MDDRSNTSAVRDSNIQEDVTHTSESQTRVQAQDSADTQEVKAETKASKIRKMLRAGFKQVEICRALGASPNYVFKVAKETLVISSDLPPRALLQIEPQETLVQAKTRCAKQNMLFALLHYKGIVNAACKVTGTSYGTHLMWMKEDSEYLKRVNEIQEAAVDFVENELFKQIKKGVPQSTIFYLKTKGKHRGYVERVEHSGVDGGPLEVRVIEPYVDPLADVEEAIDAEYEVMEPNG